MEDSTLPTKKIAPTWASYGADYAVEKYDFQKYKISDPPPVDVDPITIEFRKSK